MGKVCLGTVGVLAMTLLVASIALLVARVMQNAVDAQVKEETVLKNGSEVFKVWEEPPPPVYMQFYFFNLTNPLEVLQGENPIVTEIGPYTYREFRPRVDVHILDNGTKVSSFNPKTYLFEREMSVGDPEVDLIRTVNLPAVIAMETATASPLRIPTEILLLLYKENLFTVHSVHELLWGYRDKFLDTVHKFSPSIEPDFGYFKKANGTDDGEYVVLSGKKNYLDFTKIVKWNGQKSLNWWYSPGSNMINGTDGSTFHPLISTDETIYVFSSDFCRSLYINFDSYVTVKGVPAYRFVPPSKLFANVSVNPDNAGFCPPEGDCSKGGILNASVCKQGAPIFLSPPHFYEADEYFAKSVNGMHPNKEDHETFLDINPLTGVLVRAAKRMQVNVLIRKLTDFPIQTSSVRTLIYPVLYINESTVLDDASAKQLKTILLQSSLVNSIPFIIMALGIVFGVIFVVLASRPSRAREESTEDERAPLIRTT